MSKAIITARVSSPIHTEVLEFVFETGDEVNLEAFRQKVNKRECSRVHASEGSDAAGSDYFGPSAPITGISVIGFKVTDSTGVTTFVGASASEHDAPAARAPEADTAIVTDPQPVIAPPAPSSEPQPTV